MEFVSSPECFGSSVPAQVVGFSCGAENVSIFVIYFLTKIEIALVRMELADKVGPR